MSASFALQTALRQRLVAATSVTSLVPASSIVDRSKGPEVFPSIIIGEDQWTKGDLLSRRDAVLYPTLHVWTTEPGLEIVKSISHSILQALRDPPFFQIDSTHHVAGLSVESMNFLRDPDRIHAHGVITLEARLVEFST